MMNGDFHGFYLNTPKPNACLVQTWSIQEQSYLVFLYSINVHTVCGK